MSFVNPMFLFGMAAIAVPIIIHLINRRRYRIVDWAAMEYLLEAYRERKRRVQLEDLLLLLLRCLAALLLALLIARPFLAKSGLTEAIGTSGAERIIIIDDTASMQAQVGEQTAFDRSIDAATSLIDRLAVDRRSDRVVIVRASELGERQKVAYDPIGKKANEARARLQEMRCSYSRVTASDLVKGASEWLLPKGDDEKQDATNRVVYLMTDLRASEWTEQAVTDEVKAAFQSCAWVIADAGGASKLDNLSVVDVRTEPPIPVAGIPYDLIVRVTNHGRQTAKAVPVEVELDGAKIPKREIEEIGPGKTETIVVPAPPKENGGWLDVVVRLADDPLDVDNVHFHALRIKAGVEVLIVDGDGSSTLEQQDSYFLAKALDPRGQFRSGISPEVVSPAQFQQKWDLNRYDLIILTNTLPTAMRIEALESYVKGGGAVCFMLGDKVDHGEANRNLFKEGAGLLPLEIGESADLLAASGSQTDPVNFNPQVSDEPLSIFSGKTNPLRRQVHIYRAFLTDEPEELPRGTSVLCTYTDTDGHVAMATKTLGRGRTFLLTTSIDLSWGDWPKDPSYLVFANQLVSYLTAHRGKSELVRPGGTFHLNIDPARHGKSAVFHEAKRGGKPGKKRDSDAAERKGSQGLWHSMAVGSQPGIVRYELTPVVEGAPDEARQAVNVDPVEGSLARVDFKTLEQRLGEAKVEFVDLSDSGSQIGESLAGEKYEIWPLIFAILLACLIIESTLAFVFGLARR